MRAMDQRLVQLESTITSLLESSATRAPLERPLSQEVESLARAVPSPADSTVSLHSMAKADQPQYRDTGHWHSVLDDIAEIREHIALSERSDENASQTQTPSRASEQNPLMSILATLPPRNVCDTLIAYYFNSWFMNLGIVHTIKFQAEYSDFWKDQASAKPLWVALLFSVLSVGNAMRMFSNASTQLPSTSVHGLQVGTRECLELGRYRSGNDHVLEAYMLLMQSEFLNRTKCMPDLWYEMGIIIRLAVRMGYHREPDRLKGISPLQGEMRRRVWLNIVQLETLLSYQMGVPSMIPSHVCDISMPRNLHFSDFTPDTTELPLSRPMTEETSITYQLVKHTIVNCTRMIITWTEQDNVPISDPLLIYDELLRVYDAIPPAYKAKDIADSLMDPVSMIWHRVTIEMLHLKNCILLSRSSLTSTQSSGPDSVLRELCIDAALKMLHRQNDLHEATKPGGRMCEVHSKMATVPGHDFLLAAMVICLNLSGCLRSTNVDQWDEKTKQSTHRQYTALITAREIWSYGTPCPERRTATLGISLMIDKLSALKIDSLSQDCTPASTQFTSPTDPPLMFADEIGHIIDSGETIDWTMMERYLQNIDPFTLELNMNV